MMLFKLPPENGPTVSLYVYLGCTYYMPTLLGFDNYFLNAKICHLNGLKPNNRNQNLKRKVDHGPYKWVQPKCNSIRAGTK